MRVALPATGAHASADGSLRALGGPRVLRFCVQTQMPCYVMMLEDVMMPDDVMMSDARGPGRPRAGRVGFILVFTVAREPGLS